jgi:hypothetical protein
LPNSKAYVAVTVHLEHNGVPLCMLLDIVEVARSHSGVNLAEEFVKILDDFSISNKVSNCQQHKHELLTENFKDTQYNM